MDADCKNPAEIQSRRPAGWDGRRGNHKSRVDVMSKRSRNAYCSFCRKSYQDVGPLVEGPGDVFICVDCIELCQSIIEQERRRRDPTKRELPSADEIQQCLDLIFVGQKTTTRAIA